MILAMLVLFVTPRSHAVAAIRDTRSHTAWVRTDATPSRFATSLPFGSLLAMNLVLAIATGTCCIPHMQKPSQPLSMMEPIIGLDVGGLLPHIARVLCGLGLPHPVDLL